MSLDTIANELVLKIFEDVFDDPRYTPSKSVRLLRICKSLFEPIGSLVYRKVTARRYDALVSLVDSIQRNPSFATFIRSLTLCVDIATSYAVLDFVPLLAMLLNRTANYVQTLELRGSKMHPAVYATFISFTFPRCVSLSAPYYILLNPDAKLDYCQREAFPRYPIMVCRASNPWPILIRVKLAYPDRPRAHGRLIEFPSPCSKLSSPFPECLVTSSTCSWEFGFLPTSKLSAFPATAG
ncbi:hypothetical protein VNI00_017284 [Paramarasmius palmivorus]|uniref:F-box domain-containing protein n=1 Tax=Paramarasmius palmivorus TaxID=297713 RepID=A0AAW0B8F7_9AGAR